MFRILQFNKYKVLFQLSFYQITYMQPNLQQWSTHDANHVQPLF